MSAWSLLFVPASLALIVVLLFTVSWIEQRVLSPRALIVHTALSRASDPEQAEAFVAGQARNLIDGLTLRPTSTADAPVLDVAETP